MNLQEFSEQFFENIEMEVEMNETSYDEELANAILEYIVDCGDSNAPEYCSYNERTSRITAYDYNDETECLDLFYLLKADNRGGKINASKIQQGINFLTRFYKQSLDGSLVAKPENKNTDIEEVANLIVSAKAQLKTVRFFVMSDGIGEADALPSSVEGDDGVIQEYSLWDLHRVYQQNSIQSGKEKIEVDFQTTYDTELQCIKMIENNPDVDAYLAIIPGITLAKIYNEYKQALLERNVRTFLQFKSKVNKGIRKTLQERPHLFFSFNNGISTTATEIDTEERDGMRYITRLYDWQIVNGGQTTASIAAMYNQRCDLSKVFVPMKVSIIKDADKQNSLVPDISMNANSQTAIKNSDFSANDPYLVELERLSRSTWVPNGNQKSVLKWYFERTRGQYLDELSHLHGFDEKEFRRSYPKNHKFAKTDLAKYEMCWLQRPSDVCKGGEKNYQLFVDYVKKSNVEVNELYYKHLVAKCILFKEVDKIVKSKELGGYKSNVVAYTLASLSFKSSTRLDLTSIWEKQLLAPHLCAYIDKVITIVWECITNPPKEGMNVNEWTKKLDCWNNLKGKLDSIGNVDDSLLMSKDEAQAVVLNDSQKRLIEEMSNIDSSVWFNLSKWAKENNELSPLDRKAAYGFGFNNTRHNKMSIKQAQYARKILEKARESGFKE